MQSRKIQAHFKRWRNFGISYKNGAEIMAGLYETIAQLCVNKGITVTELCRQSGASRGSLSDLKMGRKQSLSADTLSKIASYFGVSVDYLLGTYTKPRGRTISTSDPSDRYAYLLGKLLDGTITPAELEELAVWQRWNKLGGYFQRLNEEGQREAEKRVKELTEIPRYQLQPEAPTADATPSEGKDPAQE